MNTNTYTAPAVVACTDAVQNTMGIEVPPGDSSGSESLGAPGTVGFHL